MAAKSADILIGTQGWNYPSWKENFYGKTPQSKYLEFYSSQFPLVEIASSRYGIPSLSNIKRWKEVPPPEFAFTAKMPDRVTHDQKLQDSESAAVEFLSRMAHLGNKLHVIILEFAPSFRVATMPILDKYLGSLSSDFKYAVEIRHKSWLTEEFYQMLSHHNVAFAVSESPDIPHMNKVTADFAFIRLIGNWSDVPYGQFERIIIDRSKEVKLWAKDIVENKKKGIRTYCIVNNHFAGHSPESARMLEKQVARLLKAK